MGRQYEAVLAVQQPGADQLDHRALYSVEGGEAAGPGVQRPRDLGDGQGRRVLVEQEHQNDVLGLGVLRGRGAGLRRPAVRRVLVSHEEVTLLVVRRPACAPSAAGRRFSGWRDQLSTVGGEPRQPRHFPSRISATRL